MNDGTVPTPTKVESARQAVQRRRQAAFSALAQAMEGAVAELIDRASERGNRASVSSVELEAGWEEHADAMIVRYRDAGWAVRKDRHGDALLIGWPTDPPDET